MSWASPESLVEGAAPAWFEPRGHALLLGPDITVHRMLVDGVTVEYRRNGDSIAGAQARVIDFDAPASNHWLALDQFTASEGQHTWRPDVVLFVNGFPLAVSDGVQARRAG